LQVEAKDGSWIPAEPVPGAFVVNIGDIIDTLTSHLYKSTFHRVIHRGNKYRVSIPFFFEPSIDTTIFPLEGLVPEGDEGKVKPFKVSLMMEPTAFWSDRSLLFSTLIISR